MVQPVVMNPFDSLSPVELETLRLIASGCSNKGIQDMRKIAHSTLSQQIYGVYRKLGIHQTCNGNARVIATRMYIEKYGL